MPKTLCLFLQQVLFPLLDNVRSLSNSASSEKVDTGGNILIHHSRNTAQKQWAETQVHSFTEYKVSHSSESVSYTHLDVYKRQVYE